MLVSVTTINSVQKHSLAQFFFCFKCGLLKRSDYILSDRINHQMCVGVVGRSSVVQRALELEGLARRRARFLRGAAINAALLLALAADLSMKCAGYMSVLHWVELGLAGVAGANLLRLALALASPAPPPLPLSPHQRRLLALTDPALDSSFRVEEPSVVDSISSMSASSAPDEDLSLSLSPARSWRGGAERAEPRPSPPSPDHSPEPTPRDCFIADRHSLAEYLQEYESRQRAVSPANVPLLLGSPSASHSPPPPYQLALSREEGAAGGEGEAAGGTGGAGGEASGGLAAAARRLHLDPTRLTQFNLNLRIWLHVTIISRLVREVDSVRTALSRLGVCGALAEWPSERLRALAAAAHAPPALAQLLPFIEPFPNRTYVIQRVKALGTGGALSEYRGALGGGPGKADSDPTDAELLLHLFATYVDGQLPLPDPPRAFSTAFISKAPATPPKPLALHRVARGPGPGTGTGTGPGPHYVVVLEGEVLDVGWSPRTNLLNALLVFLAGAHRLQPAALRRTHLGPAGLNLLWVIGR